MQKRNISEVKIVISGAGSAAISCASLYISLGAKIENITMFDVDGVLHTKRNDLSPLQKKFANAKEGVIYGRCYE